MQPSNPTTKTGNNNVAQILYGPLLVFIFFGCHHHLWYHIKENCRQEPSHILPHRRTGAGRSPQPHLPPHCSRGKELPVDPRDRSWSGESPQWRPGRQAQLALLKI